jgi:hypothetical protein
MRRLGWIALVALGACGPKVNVDRSPYEYDDPAAGAPAQQSQFKAWEQREEAPKGAGLRGGTLDRTALLGVLDAGPGQFLRQLEVTNAMDGNRFVGWQLVQVLDKESALHQLDLVEGDVLIAVNGSPLSRPDQLMTMWDGLRTADAITCDILRGEARFQIVYEIQPPIGRVPPDLQTTTAPQEPATPAAPTVTPPAPTTPAPAAPSSKIPAKIK